MEREFETLRIFWNGSVPFTECIYLLGLRVMHEHLTTVANFYLGDTRAYRSENGRGQFLKAVEESLVFVQGSGIDTVLEAYGMGVDPNSFKEAFVEWIQYQQRKRHQSSSSSLTIWGD